MTDRGMNKVVLVKRRTRYEELKRRYNTIEQAKFYIEHLGADFSDYELEDRNYNNALENVRNLVRPMARLQEIDREYISNMIFGPKDIVIAVGQDGLVANTMKYLARGFGFLALGTSSKRSAYFSTNVCSSLK